MPKRQPLPPPEKPVAGKYPAGISCGQDFKPFRGVEWSHIRKFPNRERFHIIAYRAYDSHGLIGSEWNGVAVVHLPRVARKRGGEVVAAEMLCSGSGWGGLTQNQLDLAYRLAVCSWEEFREVVNGADRLRCRI
jgi:hypothetical protein